MLDIHRDDARTPSSASFATSSASADRSLGLGLTIAGADGRQVSDRDLPGIGCVFATHLPRRAPD